jgi:hypothetical protein
VTRGSPSTTLGPTLTLGGSGYNPKWGWVGFGPGPIGFWRSLNKGWPVREKDGACRQKVVEDDMITKTARIDDGLILYFLHVLI